MTSQLDTGLLARWKLVTAAAVNPKSTKSDIAVLVAILSRVNAEGEAWPSLNLVAKDAGVSRGQAVKSVRWLVDAGYLVRVSGTRTSSNRYRPGRLDPEPRREPEPRLQPDTEVGANRSLQVGSNRSPELVHKNQYKKKSISRTSAVTFRAWQAQATPEQLDQVEDQVSGYLTSVRVPIEISWIFLEWAAIHFSSSDKRYRDWPKALMNYARNGWHRLWYFAADGNCHLSTAGQQLWNELHEGQRRSRGGTAPHRNNATERAA